MFLHAEELSWISDLLCLSDSSREAIKDETFLAWGFLHGFINDPHNQVIWNKLSLKGEVSIQWSQKAPFLLASNLLVVLVC
jgi:hypothetical protein